MIDLKYGAGLISGLLGGQNLNQAMQSYAQTELNTRIAQAVGIPAAAMLMMNAQHQSGGRSGFSAFTRAAFSSFTYVGANLAIADLTIGNLYNRLTGRGNAQFSWENGAAVVRNSGTQNFLEDIGAGSGAFTPAPFIFAGTNATNNPATMAHEFGHIDQYYDWDPLTYIAFGVNRITHVTSTGDRENNADSRQGTNDYGNNPVYNAILLQLCMPPENFAKNTVLCSQMYAGNLRIPQ